MKISVAFELALSARLVLELLLLAGMVGRGVDDEDAGVEAVEAETPASASLERDGKDGECRDDECRERVDPACLLLFSASPACDHSAGRVG